nr:peptide ABC transporter substrate-binding protein [Clostridia bacterium]
AINCEEVLLATYGGAYELGSCYMDSAQPFWYTDVGEDRYNLNDPEKAKAILAENGYAGEPFRILVANLNGVPVELNIVDWATLTEYRKDPANFDMYMTTFAGVPVPSLKLYFGPEYPGWSEDAVLAEKFAKMNEAKTMESAKEAWVELQDYSWDYLPLINAGHYITTYAWSNKLENVNTFSGCYFWNATIAK